MSIFVVGDIQGCLKSLKCVLRKVAFREDKDVLWSVGDIVNRGPKSLKTLRYLYERRENVVTVLGNHDLHLMAISAGVKKPNRDDTLVVSKLERPNHSRARACGVLTRPRCCALGSAPGAPSRRAAPASRPGGQSRRRGRRWR